MNSRERFLETIRLGRPDRPPYFEEGLRPEVITAWRKQGLPADDDPGLLFPSDGREEIWLDVDPRPKPESWPRTAADLKQHLRRLDAQDPGRLPEDWPQNVAAWRNRDHVLMMRLHRGFFQTLGVLGWDRFLEVMYLAVDEPGLVKDLMTAAGSFTAEFTDRVLNQVEIDAAIFSEPIGGPDRPLLSPDMYADLVLPSYRPVLEVLRRHGVETVIWRTYANSRLLLPVVVESGFNCLWACETTQDAMDYLDIRREFGPELRLIGGIDLDALRQGRDAVRREIEAKVPPLLAQGGYVPLADGRVREDVPYDTYAYYRGLLAEVIGAL